MSTEIKIIKLALERLMEEIEMIKKENKSLRADLDELKNRSIQTTEVIQKSEPVSRHELIDTKEVLKILGVSYNTLRVIVRNGGLNPVRINQRRVRYSKAQLFEFIEMKQNEN